MIEHEQADRGRKIALAAGGIDSRDHFRQRRAADRRNLLQRLPKRVFKTDARLVTRNHDRTFDHRTLDHESSPDSRRRPSSSRARFNSAVFTSWRAASERPKRTRFEAAFAVRSARAFAL